MEQSVKLGVATLVAVLSATIGAGVAWGTYSSRLNTMEANLKVVEQQQQSLLEIQSQYRVIIYRLDRIEGLARSKQ
jgi:hypothetical protein